MLSDIIFIVKKNSIIILFIFFLRINGGESYGRGREKVLFGSLKSFSFSKERGFPDGYDSLFMVVTFCAKVIQKLFIS